MKGRGRVQRESGNGSLHSGVGSGRVLTLFPRKGKLLLESSRRPSILHSHAAAQDWPLSDPSQGGLCLPTEWGFPAWIPVPVSSKSSLNPSGLQSLSSGVGMEWRVE